MINTLSLEYVREHTFALPISHDKKRILAIVFGNGVVLWRMAGEVGIVTCQLWDGVLTALLVRVLVSTTPSADAVVAPTPELCMANEMMVFPFGGTDRRGNTVSPRHSLSLMAAIFGVSKCLIIVSDRSTRVVRKGSSYLVLERPLHQVREFIFIMAICFSRL